MDGAPGALNRAHPAAETERLVDHRAVLLYPNGSCRTDFLAHPAAYAADLALFPRRGSFIPVGALDYNVIGAVVYADDLLRAGPDTGSTGNALLLRHLRHAVLIHGNGIKLARSRAAAAAGTAIGAFAFRRIRPAAAITGYQCGFIGEFLLHCHGHTLLS